MNKIVNFPVLIFVLSFIVLWLSTLIGDFFRKRVRPLQEQERSDFNLIQAATLTLLGLIIGFTFSMAVSRYDQRKNYEAEEANAIGTEYVRADLLPAADAARVRELLKDYVDQRVLFYETRDLGQLQRINTYTAQLQRELWSTVQAAADKPTPIVALAVSGMNDVLNSQAYTQAAWWNRLPSSARILLFAIAVGCNLLIGYGAHRTNRVLFLVFPLAVSVSFFLITDIDSPRGGLVYVVPRDLVSLSQYLHAH